MADYPHFTLPFAWTQDALGGLSAAVAEQESIAEIGTCVEAIIRTVQGQRTTLPEFGVPQLEFNPNPEVAAAAVASAVLEHEPRVEALVSAGWDDDDVEVQVMRALIAPADDQEGPQT